MLNRRLLLGALITTLVSLGACERHSYSVKVAADPADPAKLIRTLEFRSRRERTDDLVRAEIDRLASLYGEKSSETTAEPSKLADILGLGKIVHASSGPVITFKGTFDSPPPDFKGGGGIYACYTSDLGAVRLYAEQFKGNYYLADRLECQRKACVLAGECLAVLVEQEMSTLPRATEFAAFARTKFVSDLHDFLLAIRFESSRFSTDELIGSDPESAFGIRMEVMVRLSQFMIERGYLTRADAGCFIKSALDMFSDDARPFTAESFQWFVRSLVLKAAGEGATELADRLAQFVSSEAGEEGDKFKSAIDRVVVAPSVRKLLGPTSPVAKGEKELSGPDQLQFDMAPLFQVLGLIAFDRFSLELSFPGELVTANAHPYQGPGGATVVSWQTESPIEPAEDLALPKIAVAAFAAPAAESQTLHLGGVKLKGHALVNYCFAYAKLEQSEREQWTRDVSARVFAQATGTPTAKGGDMEELSPSLAALRNILLHELSEGESEK